MPHVSQHVERGAGVNTDSLPSYVALESDYTALTGKELPQTC